MYSQAVSRHFPQGTKISRPLGGYVLWVELPKNVDALKLYRMAVSQKICILPGVIFSASGRFENHIRLSCGHPFTDAIERAVVTLGKLCEVIYREE